MISNKELRRISYITLGMIALVFISIGTLSFDKTYSQNLNSQNYIDLLKGSVSFRSDFFEQELRSPRPISKDQSFMTGEDGQLSLSIDNRTLLKLDNNTKIYIKETSPPEIEVFSGKIWIDSFQEVKLVHSRSAIFIPSGSGMFEVSGTVLRILAWENPFFIRFFGEGETTPDQVMTLASGYQVSIDYSGESVVFNSNLANLTPWIQERIDEKIDLRLKAESVIRNYSTLESVSVKDSVLKGLNIFKAQQDENYDDLMIQKIWKYFEQENIKNIKREVLNFDKLTEENKNSIYSMIGILPISEEKISIQKSYFQKKYPKIPQSFFSFFELDQLSLLNDETIRLKKFNNYLETLTHQKEKDMILGNDDIEKWIQYLLQNIHAHPHAVGSMHFKFLQDLQELMFKDLSDDFVLRTFEYYARQKLNLIDDLLSVHAYEATQMMLADISNSLFTHDQDSISEIRDQIKAQKDYYAKKLLFFEITGGGTEEAFQRFLSRSEEVRSLERSLQKEEEQLQKNILPEEIISQFEEVDIFISEINVDKDLPHIFFIDMAKTADEIEFSGVFNIDTQMLEGVIAFVQGKEVSLDLPYSFENIELFKKNILSLNDIQEEDSKDEKKSIFGIDLDSLMEDERSFLAPEVVDVVIELTKNDFKPYNLLIQVTDMEVISKDTVKIYTAKTQYTKEDTIMYEDDTFEPKVNFSFECFYNVEKKQVYQIVLLDKNYQFNLSQVLKIDDAISTLEKEVIRQEKKAKRIDDMNTSFLKWGFLVEEDSFVIIDDTHAIFEGLLHQKSGFLFSGEYDMKNLLVIEVSEKSRLHDTETEVSLSDFSQSVMNSFYEREKALEEANSDKSDIVTE